MDREIISQEWVSEGTGYMKTVEKVSTPRYAVQEIDYPGSDDSCTPETASEGMATDETDEPDLVTSLKAVIGNLTEYDTLEMTSGYTLAGEYIGNIENTEYLCVKMGIKPELSSQDHRTCSIGFCQEEQKWYGWSHRAIYGFGVGSQVKQGDCGYRAFDEADELLDCVRFWDSDFHVDTTARVDINDNGEKCIFVEWVYNDTVPNKKLRGTKNKMEVEYPDFFGRGEWTAKSLEDGKQMAIDFAEGVS